MHVKVEFRFTKGEMRPGGRYVEMRFFGMNERTRMGMMGLHSKESKYVRPDNMTSIYRKLMRPAQV